MPHLNRGSRSVNINDLVNTGIEPTPPPNRPTPNLDQMASMYGSEGLDEIEEGSYPSNPADLPHIKYIEPGGSPVRDEGEEEDDGEYTFFVVYNKNGSEVTIEEKMTQQEVFKFLKEHNAENSMDVIPNPNILYWDDKFIVIKGKIVKPVEKITYVLG